MKRTLLTLLTMVALGLTATLRAQTSPSLIGGADSLSQVFSKEFLVDTPFIMNFFSYTMQGTVAEDGSLTWTDGHLNSSYTVSLPSQTVNFNSNKEYLNILLSKVKEYLIGKIEAKEIRTIPGTFDGVPVEMPIEITLTYAPFFYAQTGDTLFCSRETHNKGNAYGEKPAMFYRFYVRNGQETPYFAVARRDKASLTLHCYDTISEFPFLVARYVVYQPDKIIKNGFQQYLSGKKIQYRQFYEADTMRYAEEFNEANKIGAKYFFTLRTNNVYPQLQYKEIYYPSGQLKQRVVYPDLKMVLNKNFTPNVYAYREDGSEAKYSPSANAEAVVTKYFRKNFKAPKLHGKANGINYLIAKPILAFYVDAEGNMQFRGKISSSTDWSYNYQKGVNPADINQLIRDYYGPYLESFLLDLENQTLTCKPSLMDKKPTESIVIVNLEFDFSPR